MVRHVLAQITTTKNQIVRAESKLLPHLSSSLKLSRALQEEGKLQLTLVSARPFKCVLREGSSMPHDKTRDTL
jgi:hypothetical protein